jgi:glutaminyl-peptide cyclotransferase
VHRVPCVPWVRRAALSAAFALAACAGTDAQNRPPREEAAPPKASGATSAPAAAGAAVPTFDSSRAWEHLRRQVSFGPRPSGSAANAETRRYILDQLRAAGIEGREQRFEAQTPIGPIKMANVVATIPGARGDRIALATHFDTKLERRFRFVGASDSASSTAAVLELARVLARRKNPFTIELLFFDGEEAIIDWSGNDHTYGSRHYVETAKKAGTLGGLKALVLLDLIGDRNLRIRRESNSTEWLTDVIWATAKGLGYGHVFVDEEFSVGGDDHFEFLAVGVPAVDIIDLEYPAWHTVRDDLEAVSARSLQIVGDVVLAALPAIEKRLAAR